MDESYEFNISKDEKIIVNYFGEANGTIKQNLEKQLNEVASTPEIEFHSGHFKHQTKFLQSLKEHFTLDFLMLIMRSPLFVT